MYFDHYINYVKFLFESNYNFIGTLQYKLFVFLSEEKESYLHEKQKNKTKTKTNSETQRLVQNVILKLEKIKMVLMKRTMVKHPLRTKLVKRCGVYVRDTYETFSL